MKLLFVSYSPIAMDVTMPEREPLGGSESCVAYLTRQLAANGHDVTFAARLPPGTPLRVKAVRHVPLEALEAQFFAGEDFDAVVSLSAPGVAQSLKSRAPRAFHAVWLHLLADQSAMAPLAAMTPWIDCAVFVSATHRDMTPYAGKRHVIGNAIAPAFENMFANASDLLAAKQNRAVYTSMPYRGLALLIEIIQQARPRTAFDIYSAMQTYRFSDSGFAALYEQARALPRTRYYGAVAQPELARQLRSATFFAYPCTFVETFCIAALEAMAAGLKVVSIDMGALKETTLGFADLLPLAPGMTGLDVVAPYAALLEKNIAAFQTATEEWAARMFEQSRTVNRLCSWRARAGEWEEFLAPRIAATRRR